MNFLQDKFLDFLINFLNHDTEKRLLFLSGFFKFISFDPQSKSKANNLHWLFKTKHPYSQWWQRVFTNLNPISKKKFFANDFTGGVIQQLLNDGHWKKRMAFIKTHGFEPPNVLTISITKNCNFSCTGCWARKYKDAEEMSYERCKEMLEEAGEMGINSFYIVGGEPFIREDFLKLAEEFPQCLFFTYTNGSFLNDEKIEKIKNLGNIYPLVSVNGFKDSNDTMRGEGTYEMVLEKLDKLRNAGIFFGTSVVATRHNAEEVTSLEFLKMLSDKGAFMCWIFNCLPIGEKEDMELLPTPEQRIEMYKSTVYARNILPMISFSDFGDSLELGGCTAARRQVHINAKGDVEPCPLFHIATHNLSDCSLAEALKSPLFDAFRKDIPFDGNMLRPCVILDRPEILQEYMNKFKPYETHEGAMEYFKNPQTREKLFEYSNRVKELMDKAWSEKKYMGLYPSENQWYYDKEHFCGYEKPLNGKHGGGYPKR